MPRTNDQVEAALYEYADLQDLDEKGLLAIPNVGKSIAEKVHEFLEGGTFQALEELRAQIPAGVRQLMSIPTLGPKKAMALYQELHVGSVEELMDAVHEHRLAGLKGFGPKTEENILRGVQQMQQAGNRVQLGVALDQAEELLGELSSLNAARRCAYAGSLRRMVETIGDIDLLVASEQAGKVMETFTSLSYVE